MNIVIGTKKMKNNTMTAIAEFQFNNNTYQIHIFQGGLSANDIVIKYLGPYSTKLRQPSHTHWVVDLLLKRTSNYTLTTAFIQEITNFWNNCTYLQNNNYATITSLITAAVANVNFNNYSALNSYGEYDTEFIYVLTCLLALQEKTNANAHGKQAVMFRNILNELCKQNLDLYKVMSIAGFRGR